MGCISSLIVGCGTQSPGKEVSVGAGTVSQDKNNDNKIVDLKVNPDTPTYSDTQKNSDTTTVHVVKNPPPEKELSWDFEGSKENQTATGWGSKNGYYVYVLQNFKADAEEPGKDIVQYTLDGNQWMRIERLDAKADLIQIKENVITQLKDTYPSDPKPGDKGWKDREWKDAVILNGADTTTSTTVWLFKLENVPFKVTTHIKGMDEGLPLLFDTMMKSLVVTE